MKSDGEKGAIPPLSVELWARVCAELFDSSTNAILCTDSAQAYVNYNPPTGAFVQKFHVNHSEHEYTRSVEMITDVQAQTKVVQLAGTQTIDHEWSLLKAELPRGLSAKTEEGRELMDEYWRAAQWRRLVNTTDLWAAFCRAAAQRAQQEIGGHVLFPKMQELTADEDGELAEAPVLTDNEKNLAEVLLDMVTSLTSGELERLEQAIASRKAEAGKENMPLGFAQPSRPEECPLCTEAFACALHAASSNEVGRASSVGLGEAAPGVPAGVHKAMEELLLKGCIPRTSLEQRLRRGPTPGSGHGVPAGLREAFQHRYIHPNLPPPTGMKWVCSGRVWRLIVQGG